MWSSSRITPSTRSCSTNQRRMLRSLSSFLLPLPRVTAPVSSTTAARPLSLRLATIHDKDILIYCISQLIGKMNQGERPSRTLHLTARDLLVWTNRHTAGDGYDRRRSAFERLSWTRITTNIKADGEDITEGFGLINEWRIVRRTRAGQMSTIRVTPSHGR